MDNKMKLNVMMELKKRGFENKDIVTMVNDGKVFMEGAMDMIDGMVAMEFGKAEIVDMVVNGDLIEAPKPEVPKPESNPEAPKKGKKGTGKKPSKYNWVKDFDEAEYKKKAIEMGVAIMEGDKFIKVGAKNREKVYRACGFIK